MNHEEDMNRILEEINERPEERELTWWDYFLNIGIIIAAGAFVGWLIIMAATQ